MFVTLLYGILDTKARSFSYARAGHELPLILSKEGRGISFEHGRGQPLGLFETPTLDQADVELPEGSLMALYTDGITDTMDDKQVRYGTERFRAALSDSIGERARVAVDRVWEEVDAFRGDVEQYDDLTLFILKAH
jgi:sigma-B regulation protein RsbU (phosphoserine phosphatase)